MIEHLQQRAARIDYSLAATELHVTSDKIITVPGWGPLNK